jgi:RNA polymerase sigma factor (TIGR02999 family)
MQAERAAEYRYRQRSAESLATRAIYPQLLRIAGFHLRRDSLGYLWSPEALVNEAYIRLVSHYGKEWVGREKITVLWSRIMRNVLIDNARSLRATKRNGGQSETAVDECSIPADDDLDLAIIFRRAMESIRTADPRQAEVLEMRFRDGFTVGETAAQLKVSRRTVERISEAARGRFLQALA